MDLTAEQMAEETKRLHELEALVHPRLRDFVIVGRALAEIRDRALYLRAREYERGGVPSTFEWYVEQEFGLGRAHAYRLIDAAQAVEAVSPMGDIITNERQAREVSQIVKQANARTAKQVLRRVKRSPLPVTADRIGAAWERLRGPVDQPLPKLWKRAAQQPARRTAASLVRAVERGEISTEWLLELVSEIETQLVTD